MYKDYLTKAFFVIAGGAIVFSIMTLLQKCNPSQSNVTSTKDTVVIYVKDTNTYTAEAAKIAYLHDTVVYEKFFYKQIDTGLTLKDYYAQRDFSFAISDTNLEGNITGALWKNSLYGNPKFTYKLIKPQTIIIQKTLEEKLRNKVFIGLFADYTNKLSGGFALSLLSKKERLYQIYYDPFFKGYGLSYSGKIHF